MTRDGLPRAYLRIDPNIDQAYPELRNTFVGLMCSAGRQPDRGRYRSRSLVEGLHSRTFIARCYARGDLRDLPDGRPYVVGWDEWQEGDMTVAERMRRMRDRRRSHRNGVTDAPSLARNAVTTDAGTTTGLTPSLGVGVGVGVETPQPPSRGGRRADATNPRAMAARLTAANEQRERERLQRRKDRQRAYLDGRITESQREDMNDRDAPLDEIPTVRGAAYSKASA